MVPRRSPSDKRRSAPRASTGCPVTAAAHQSRSGRESVLLGSFRAGSRPAATKARLGGPLPNSDREAQVGAFVEEVWNHRNYDAAGNLYGENYSNPFGSGPSARVEPIRRYHQ